MRMYESESHLRSIAEKPEFFKELQLLLEATSVDIHNIEDRLPITCKKCSPLLDEAIAYLKAFNRFWEVGHGRETVAYALETPTRKEAET